MFNYPISEYELVFDMINRRINTIASLQDNTNI